MPHRRGRRQAKKTEVPDKDKRTSRNMQTVTSEGGQVYELHHWAERGFSAIELRHEKTQNTVFELRDQDADQAFEDGFLKPATPGNLGALARSMLEYADHLGLVKKFEHERGFDREQEIEREPSL